jgi:hypothetical protein
MFEFWAGTCYLGLLPLMLGGFALFSLRRREASAESSQRCLVLFSVVLILFGLLMASGRYAPLYMWFHHLPLFDRIRWPSKYLLWTLYGLALLAGVGYQAIVTLTERGLAQKARWWAAGVAGAGFIALCAGYISARSGSHLVQSLAGSKAHLSTAHLQGVLADYSAALVFFLLSFAVLLARMSCRTRTPWIDAAAVGLVFANLLFVSRQVQPVISDSVCQVGRPAFLRPERAGPDSGRIHSTYAWVQQWLYGEPHADIFEWGQQAGLGNSWMPFGIYQSWPGGLGLERNLAVVAMIKDLPAAQAGHLADLLGIHWVLSGDKVEDILSRRVIPHFTLQERANCLPRAYLAGRWQEIRDPLQVLPQMFSPSFVPGFDAVVEPTAAGRKLPSDAPLPLPTLAEPKTNSVGQVLSLRDDGNRLGLEAQITQRALLVLNDTWYPGWQAKVDGALAPVFRVNFLFRGIFLEPGRHTVEFVYRPWQFYSTLWVSLLSGFALLLLLLRNPDKWKRSA